VSLHEKDRDRVELVGTGGVQLTRTSQVSIASFCGKQSLGRWGPHLGSTTVVQAHRPLFGTWDRFCRFHLSDRDIRGSVTLGREPGEYGCTAILMSPAFHKKRALTKPFFCDSHVKFRRLRSPAISL
jgi:hypothetical protein